MRNLARLAALEAEAPAAAEGDTLLHCDVRADNLLLSGDRVWLRLRAERPDARWTVAIDWLRERTGWK